MRSALTGLWLAAAMPAAAGVTGRGTIDSQTEIPAPAAAACPLCQAELTAQEQPAPAAEKSPPSPPPARDQAPAPAPSAQTGPAVAAKLPGPNGHQLVPVPAGSYKIGTPRNATNPPRTARLAAFRIADAETTNAQFAKFVEATGHRTDAEKRGSAHTFRYGEGEWRWIDVTGASWRRPRGPEGPDAVKELAGHPVTSISAADAAAYCAWAGGRLPTQAEWEVAARAGSTARYPWGDVWQDDRANIWNGLTHAKNTLTDGWEFTAPVRSFPPNAWGLHDVIGNVFEFVSDLPPTRKPDPHQPLTSARGGSWWCSRYSCNAYNLLDAGTMPLHGSLPNQGFRLALSGEK